MVFAASTLVAAILVFYALQIFRGPKQVHARLAMPLALAERALHDALEELVAAAKPAASQPKKAFAVSMGSQNAPADWQSILQASQPLFSVPQPLFMTLEDEPLTETLLYINAFEDGVNILAAFSKAELASLGKTAWQEYGILMRAIRGWNASAGKEAHAKSLLPTILRAHHATQNLTRLLHKDEMMKARNQVAKRILHALLACRSVALES